MQHLGVAPVAAATHPAQPLGHQRRVRAHPAQDFLRAPRHADGAAAAAVALVRLDNQVRNALAREQGREGEAYRAATGNEHWNGRWQ